jgi:hypothetical protein
MTTDTEIIEDDLYPEEENPELWERVLMMVGVIGFKEEKAWIEDEREKIWKKIESLPEESLEIPESILDTIASLMDKVISESKIPEIENVLKLIPDSSEDFLLFRNRISLILLAHFDMLEDDTESKKGLIEEYVEFIKEEFIGFEEDYDSAYEEFDLSLSEREDVFLANFFPERYEADLEDDE